MGDRTNQNAPALAPSSTIAITWLITFPDYTTKPIFRENLTKENTKPPGKPPHKGSANQGRYQVILRGLRWY